VIPVINSERIYRDVKTFWMEEVWVWSGVTCGWVGLFFSFGKRTDTAGYGGICTYSGRWRRGRDGQTYLALHHDSCTPRAGIYILCSTLTK
jgi:hypothetical protein